MIGIALGLALVLGAAFGWSAIASMSGIAVFICLIQGRMAGWAVLLPILALLGCVRVYERDEPVVPAWVDGRQALVGSVASGPIESGRAQRFDVVASQDLVSIADGPPARLCATAPVLPELHFGDRIRFTGSIQRLDAVEQRTAGYLRSRGCAGSVSVERMEISRSGVGGRAWLDRVRREMTETLQATFPGDAGALMAGLVTGDDAGLATERRDAFIVTGTSHVTAVSGSNLAVIVVLLMVIGGAARVARSGWWQALILATLWGYVAVIGFSPPPIRAACVATLAVTALRLGRKPDFITLSVLVAGIELLWRPQDFDSLSYRLSTISSVALVLGLGRRSPQGARGWLGHAVIATAVTQAATSPLLIPMFGRLTLYAIPANVIVGPMCAVAFPFALLAGLAGLASTTLATIIAAPAVIPVEIAMRSVSALATLPYADSESALATSVSAWMWSVAAMLAVIGLSREARGGISRLARELRLMNPRMRAMLSWAAVSGLLGAFVGLWVR